MKTFKIILNVMFTLGVIWALLISESTDLRHFVYIAAYMIIVIFLQRYHKEVYNLFTIENEHSN